MLLGVFKQAEDVIADNDARLAGELLEDTHLDDVLIVLLFFGLRGAVRLADSREQK